MINQEKRDNPEKSDWRLFAKLYGFIKPYKKYLIPALALTTIISSLSPLRPYLIKSAIDTYISNKDLNGLFQIILLIGGLVVLQGALQFGQNYLMQWIGQNTLSDMREKVFAKIHSMNMKYFDTTPIGKLVTRVTNDIEALNELFSSGVVMALADILLLIWIVAFMFYTNVELALYTLSVLPILIIATFIFKSKVRVVFRDIRLKTAAMNTFLNESISGVSSVKLFQREKHIESKFDEINTDTKKLWIKTVYYHALFFPVVELVGSLALALALWRTAGGILDKTMTIGALVAFLQYAEMFFRPVRDLAEKFTTLQSAMAAGERVMEVLNSESESDEMNRELELKEFNQKIEFKNLSFSYGGDKYAVIDASFDIKKGEKVAIVGATGSGKTTLINLLQGLYNYEHGSIMIDGKELKHINKNDLLARIAAVQQDVFLFSRSIKENVSLKRDGLADIDIEKSLRKIGAYDFVSKLEKGEATILSERGNSLSSGQKQLISFSRAHIGKPEILILDEATSSIDSQSEKIIETALDELLAGKTAVIIAHRLSTIRKADKIIVMHKGKIREIGDHNSLMQSGGIYSKLYRLQFGKAS
jgi:ATP-binding cassette subfamily B protein